MFVKNNYSKTDANGWRRKAGSLVADKDLGERVYTSRLIGLVPDLIMHGGGNTSVKVTRKNIFGKDEEILHVKGSGWNLDTIEAPGLPGVRLSPLREFRKLKKMTDEDMVNIQRNNLIDSGSPNPSVETLLHAFLPHKFVDHTHSTPFLILANLPDAKKICNKIFGDSLAIVPYIMPGFKLAKKAVEIYEKNPSVKGMLLLNHGHFTFGKTAEESYRRVIEQTNKVAAFFSLKKELELGKRHPTKNLYMIPKIRGLIADISLGKNDPMPIIDLRNSKQVLNLLNDKNLSKLENRGMASPDHVIRTKGAPLHIKNIADYQDEKVLKKHIEGFSSRYIKYFNRQSKRADEKKSILTADPKHGWLRSIGVIGVGKNAKEASATADLAEQNLHIRIISEKFGGFFPIKEKDMFDCEYWSLEQAKLGKGKPPAFEGKVVVITGGAGTIGLETAKAFSQLGANILLVDNNQKQLDIALSKLTPWDKSFCCDITDKNSAKKAIEAAIWNFGGIDILVSNAGNATSGHLLDLPNKKLRDSFELNFFAHQSFSVEAAKILEIQGRGGQILFNISKQAVNPGKGMGAYGMPKSTTMFLMRQLALELGSSGIRVNGVNADRIRSGLLTSDFIKTRAKARDISEKEYMSGNLLEKEVEARHVADAFIALAKLDRTTGHVLTVDGGNTAAELR